MMKGGKGGKLSDRKGRCNRCSDAGDKGDGIENADGRINARSQAAKLGADGNGMTNCKHSIPVLYVVPSSHWRSSMG